MAVSGNARSLKMETIYTHTKIEDITLKTLLQKIFPGVQVYKYDLINDSEPERGFDMNNPCHIFFHPYFDNEKIEFGNKIDIYRTPEENSEERAIFVGKQLSQELNLETLVTYTNPEDPSPYYSLVFKDAKSYLADDANSNFADGESEKIKILKEVNLPDYRFDDLGNLQVQKHYR